MKKLRIQKHTRTDFLTYLGVIAAFAVLSTLNTSGGLSRSLSGQLVPICCYMSMAVSLNLMSLQSAIPSEPIRLAIAMVVGALVAALAGVIVGTPVLRLRGDYLAIVTLAFGEIIKELVNCLLVGHDSRGLHIALNITGSKSIADLHREEVGIAII